MKMKSMKLKLLTALFALAFCVQGALCGTPERPGSSVRTKQLPDTIHRFLSRQFVGRQFTYRQDRDFYYAFIDEGQYVLFSRDGAVRGFRFRTMQPAREVASCIPAEYPPISGSIIRVAIPTFSCLWRRVSA